MMSPYEPGSQKRTSSVFKLLLQLCKRKWNHCLNFGCVSPSLWPTPNYIWEHRANWIVYLTLQLGGEGTVSCPLFFALIISLSYYSLLYKFLGYAILLCFLIFSVMLSLTASAEHGCCGNASWNPPPLPLLQPLLWGNINPGLPPMHCSREVCLCTMRCSPTA